ncbi:MAG: phage tail tape measure protein, partial [Hyphomicrobiaceae bacterium]|nr:phage tail tape measure protein [Hyphomicrobiaceae bacterium]
MDETTETWTVEIAADAQPLARELSRVSTLGDQFGRSMTRAFEGVAIKGKGVGDVLRGLGLRLSQLALRAAFKPLEQSISGLFGKLFGGALPFANGGVLRQGTPTPFATGGVIASPTYFPLSGGRTGLMGERGPEAIMPLARGPDGRLGVRAAGGGGV